MIAASAYPALVLNADFRPLRFYPLSLWSWQDALRATLEDRVTLVSTYARTARSPSLEVPLPSVVALRDYVPLDRPAPLNRINVFLRDAKPEGFACIYCGGIFAAEELTFDHIRPRCRGGISSFANLGAACVECNGLKADLLLDQCGLVLRHRPWHPTLAELNSRGRWFAHRLMREEWRDWLDYWTAELEA